MAAIPVGAILGLHSTSQGCHVAVLPESGAALTATAPQASSALPSLLLEVLARANVRLSELGGLAVACGPGSFTGIKIGLASAWGLARPSRVRVLGVPSLDVLVAAGRARAGAGAGLWVAVAGAYAGFVYAARYRAGERAEDVELDGEPVVGKPADVLPELTRGARVVLEGTALADVALSVLESMEVVRVLPGEQLAEALVRIAHDRDAKSLRQEARALYLRADPAKAW